jgi:hypothetical protein
MTISFDLDDTLIPGIKRFPVERQQRWQTMISHEPLRKGSILLIHILKQQGCKVYVYTTSLRSSLYIRCLFLSYGIWLDKVINKTVHDTVLGAQGADVSKLPTAFDIDLHVDDSPGVAQEGLRFNFETIIIEEQDENWTDNILAKIKSLPVR